MKVLTAREVGKILGLHTQTVYEKARAGEIPAFRVGRSWKFSREALEDWMRGTIEKRAGPWRLQGGLPPKKKGEDLFTPIDEIQPLLGIIGIGEGAGER